MNSIPDHIILEHIIPKCDPKSKLSLVVTSKSLYSSFFNENPDFRDRFYSRKYHISQCLLQMLHFVKKWNVGMASWGFRHKKMIFSIIRSSKSSNTVIGDIPSSLSDDQAIEWFHNNMLPHWSHLQLSTGCWFKSVSLREQYRMITIKMVELMALG